MKTIRILGAAAILAAAATPAFADYTILGDHKFPSVIYVEFDDSPAPTVISAPAASGEVKVMSGSDPALQPEDQSSSSDFDAEEQERIEQREAEANKSVEERVNDKIAEIEAASPESLEDIVIDNEIENEILDNVELR